MIKSLRERLTSSSETFIIGVAGDSGAGKTTFAKGILSVLGTDLVSHFSTDDYHLEDREQRTKSGILPLDPEVNRLDLYAEHLAKLKAGKSIIKPVYNHRTGRFDDDVIFKPTPIILVEGLHPYYSDEMRELVDFKIFTDPSRRVKYVWKIRRDIARRGAHSESIKEEMMAREPLFRQYVDPQKLFADIVVEIQPTKLYVNPVLQLEERTEKKKEQYRLRLIQQLLNYPIDQGYLSFNLPHLLKGDPQPFLLEYYRDVYYGRRVTVLALDGLIHRSFLGHLERHILKHMDRKEDVFYPSKEHEYLNVVEVAQLFICWRFIEKIDFLLKE